MKRQKYHMSCPNILFLKWLEEWRMDAREKGLNSQYTYAKAAASLKKYPLPLRSGKEARLIENIGDGIANKLDEALNNFLDNGGDPAELYNMRKGFDPPKKQTSKQARKRTSDSVTTSESLSCPNSSTERQSKKPCRGKEYVPAFRSGAYALLVAMHKDSSALNSKGYLLKDELKKKAQDFSDSSFFQPEAGSHYTAWSSMSTLTKKGYILKEGNPARYLLTTSGRNLASKLENIRSNTVLSVFAETDSSDIIQSDTGSLIKATNEVAPLEFSVTSHVNLAEDSSKKLHFWYVSANSDQVLGKDKALVTFTDSFGLGFLIKCDEDELRQSCVNYQIDNGRVKDGNFVFAYIKDENAPEVATPPANNCYNPAETCLTTVKVPNWKNKTINNSKETTFCSSSSSKTSKPSAASTSNSELDVETDVDKDFSLFPGDYEIVLCVDIAELGGHGKKEQLVNQLKRNGVRVDIRKLQLGDFLWIAREKRPSTQREKREIVLDFIVERKRVDDLAGSIVDGRFREQKFRLKASGLLQGIYLVEKYGSMQHLPLPEATIRQAVINTQVIDNLVLKWTDDINGSVNFLTSMTNELNRLYTGKTLHAVKYDVFKRKRANLTYRNMLKQKESYLLDFNAFSEATAKNKVLTVSQMFAKHLLQIRGIQPERAAAVIARFPTPSHLYQSYAILKTEGEKESMLADVKSGISGRRLGDAVSKQMYTIYCKKSN